MRLTPMHPLFWFSLIGFPLVFTHIALRAQPSAAQHPDRTSVAWSKVDMGSFTIDQTEVTIGQFADFANRKNMVTAAERDGGGFEYSAGWTRRPGWTFRSPYGKPGSMDEPAVHLSWHEAQAFCHDKGGRLPNRDEWSLAAYTEKRPNPPTPFVTGKTYAYPTGDSPQGANVVGDQDGWKHHAPVGNTRQGVNGLYDMGANVWEWLSDARGNDRLTAGGSWWYDAGKMKHDAMQYKAADFYAVYVGFRCLYPKP